MQQQRSPKISFREIFRVVRFSTFATISARSGRLTKQRRQQNANSGTHADGPCSKGSNSPISQDGGPSEDRKPASECLPFAPSTGGTELASSGVTDAGYRHGTKAILLCRLPHVSLFAFPWARVEAFSRLR